MKYLIKTVLLITSALLIISCGGDQHSEEKMIIESPQAIHSVQTPAVRNVEPKIDDTLAIKAITKDILINIKNQDYEDLLNYFHPDLGVRFSPYGFIDTAKNVKLNSDQFAEGIKSNKKFTWGYADGSGDPIELTIPEYFKKFVYDADFLNAEKTVVNQMIGSGNSLNNLEKIYPDALYTENYNPGKSEMDWKALKLIFKKDAGKFYLIGIVHDQWTI